MPKIKWDSTQLNPALATVRDATVTLKYDGTNYGSIYLRDIGQRNQLGGGRGLYIHGQDRYVDWSGTYTLLRTQEVMESINSGVIGNFLDKTAFHVYF